MTFNWKLLLCDVACADSSQFLYVRFSFGVISLQYSNGIFFKQGACGYHANACQRSYSWWWKPGLITLVYLQFRFSSLSFDWHGKRPSQEPPSIAKSTSFPARFSQSVKVGTIWLSWKGRVSFHFTPLSTGYGDGNLHCFSGPFSDLLRSGVTGLFLRVRCTPQQNSQWQFWASVCGCVCVCACETVWTYWEKLWAWGLELAKLAKELVAAVHRGVAEAVGRRAALLWAGVLTNFWFPIDHHGPQWPHILPLRNPLEISWKSVGRVAHATPRAHTLLDSALVPLAMPHWPTWTVERTLGGQHREHWHGITPCQHMSTGKASKRILLERERKGKDGKLALDEKQARKRMVIVQSSPGSPDEAWLWYHKVFCHFTASLCA